MKSVWCHSKNRALADPFPPRKCRYFVYWGARVSQGNACVGGTESVPPVTPVLSLFIALLLFVGSMDKEFAMLLGGFFHFLVGLSFFWWRGGTDDCTGWTEEHSSRSSPRRGEKKQTHMKQSTKESRRRKVGW